MAVQELHRPPVHLPVPLLQRRHHQLRFKPHALPLLKITVSIKTSKSVSALKESITTNLYVGLTVVAHLHRGALPIKIVSIALELEIYVPMRAIIVCLASLHFVSQLNSVMDKIYLLK
jgi:hypothetical protein